MRERVPDFPFGSGCQGSGLSPVLRYAVDPASGADEVDPAVRRPGSHGVGDVGERTPRPSCERDDPKGVSHAQRECHLSTVGR